MPGMRRISPEAEAARLARERALPDAAALRQVLREHATAVGPGETLVVQVPCSWTTSQVRDLHDALNREGAFGPVLPFRAVVVPGTALGVVSREALGESLRDLAREEVAAALAAARRTAGGSGAPGARA